MSRNYKPDALLVDRLVLDDTGAFEELFRRYCLPLYSYCVDKLDSPADAKRITRKIFVGLWEKRHCLPHDFSITCHLYTEVRKAVVQCINDKLSNVDELPAIEEKIIPGFNLIHLKRARRPVRTASRVAERAAVAAPGDERSWNDYFDSYVLRNVRHAFQKVMNFM